MKITESIEDVREYCEELKNQGKTVALVDTYGDLHSGHISLINTAKSNADAVMLNVWHCLHPYGPADYISEPENTKENLLKYKQKHFNSDIELCELNGIDLFWHFTNEAGIDKLGSAQDIVTPVLTPSIKQVIEKRYLAGIYDLPVCMDMLKIVKPNIVVLGEKDFYQTTVLSFGINALNIPVEVVLSPLVRDFDGISHSSRNKYLSSGERKRAAYIYKTLKEISEWSSYPSTEEIKKYFRNAMKNCRGKMETDRLGFIDICDIKTCEPLTVVDREAMIVVGVTIGKVFIWDCLRITPN